MSIGQHAIFVGFGLLFLKHFVVDFLLQPPWMFKNKGRFAHPGGLAHAGLHAVTSYAVLVWMFDKSYVGLSIAAIGMAMAFWVCFFEFVAHYLIDWLKMNVTGWCGWKPDRNPEFWYALGADQLLHYLTYWIMLVYWFR